MYADFTHYKAVILLSFACLGVSLRQCGLSRVCHYSRARLFLVVFCFGGRSKAGAKGFLRGILFQVFSQDMGQTTGKRPSKLHAGIPDGGR
jgi:hypothetical protein